LSNEQNPERGPVIHRDKLRNASPIKALQPAIKNLPLPTGKPETAYRNQFSPIFAARLKNRFSLLIFD